MKSSKERIVVIGLGYVGLPVAVALARKFEDVTGFDLSEKRIRALRSHDDWTGEISSADLKASTLALTASADELRDRTFFIVTVPTPIDADRRPDLTPLEKACAIIGPKLTKGSVVVFESTVYPGVTEDVCGPLLEKASGLARGKDFFLGYSPERINPGDRQHRLESITKIVAAEDAPSLERLRHVYGSIIEAGLHEAPTIKVAEAAKVLENTQRDLNIALMNELSMILDRMDIRTKDVLEAANTKWNFLPFMPGLVGGHCIGVDPYYLTHAGEKAGHNPEIILAGRRINDGMGRVVAWKLLSLLRKAGKEPASARVGILGLTFKENVPDLRNSKVPDIWRELAAHGIEAVIHDPVADPEVAREEYGITLSPLDAFEGLDALVIAVNHRAYAERGAALAGHIGEGGVIIDVKSMLDPAALPASAHYWSL